MQSIALIFSILICLFNTAASCGGIIKHHRQSHHDPMGLHAQELIFTKHNGNIHWGPDHQVAKPEVMFNTSHWNHHTLTRIWLQGLTSYSHFGHPPDTAIWHYIKYRHDLNPERFDHYHPYLKGIFTPPCCIGLLPKSPFYENLEHKYAANPVRFDANHPYLADIMARNKYAESHCTEKPPLATPEPSGLVLGFTAIAVLLTANLYKKKESIWKTLTNR